VERGGADADADVDAGEAGCVWVGDVMDENECL
jgi:hypothetical protein